MKQMYRLHGKVYRGVKRRIRCIFINKTVYIRKSVLIILLIVAAAIRLFSTSPAAVEKYYSNGVYPYIGRIQRILFGWIPFSVGDVFYALAGAWLIYQLILLIRRIVHKRADKLYLKTVTLRLITGVLAVYVAFNILWGLNYNRRGIDYQMKLDKLNYDNDDLVKVTALVAQKMNSLQPAAEKTRKRLHRKRNLFNGAVDAYDRLKNSNPAIHYNYPSVKPSIFSYIGNYLGFTGYYNPFTGEAQVNTTIPLFIRPFTTCHEIGHQLGYAKESEANFASYLSATASGDSSFMYSVYFEMFAYAGRYLYYADSMSLKRIRAQLSPAVVDDIRELRDFYRRYENPLETAVDKLYSQYLKANEQPSGRLSYNEVIAMLIAYYKKNGKV